MQYTFGVGVTVVAEEFYFETETVHYKRPPYLRNIGLNVGEYYCIVEYGVVYSVTEDIIIQ